MAPALVARIIFVPSKSCFVCVPKGWSELLHGKEVAVLEVSYGDNQKAYLSWAGEFCTTSGSTCDTAILQIDGLYGTKLNLAQDEEVTIRIWDKQCPPCERAFLEPLSIDDWEIMESNSSSIENNLMNQIRVVWSDQVFPIWVQKNVCIFVKVSNTDPSGEPVLLVHDTEVIATPKFSTLSDNQDFPKKRKPRVARSPSVERRKQAPKRTPQTSARKPQRRRTLSNSGSHDQLDDDVPELGRRDSILGIFSYFSDLVWSVFDRGGGEEDEDAENAQRELDAYTSNVKVKYPVNLVQRVVPVPPNIAKSSKTFGVLSQGSTVYLNSTSLPEEWQKQQHFFGLLYKLASPSERHEEQKKSSQSNSAEEKPKTSNTSSKSKTKKSAELNGGKQKNYNHCVVRVIIADQGDDSDTMLMQIASSLLPNYVAVPDPLRKKLGLETTSLVCLKVQTSPLKPVRSLELYPLTNLSTDCDEDDVISAFKDHLQNAFRQSPAILINPGMSMNLKIVGKARGTDFLLFPNVSSKEGTPGHTDKLSEALDKEDTVGFYLSSRDLYSDKIDITIGQPQSSLHKPSSSSVRALHEIDLPLPGVRLESLGGVKDIAERCLSFIKLSLGLSPLASHMSHIGSVYGGLVICGAKGAGKTALARALSRHVMESPYHVYVHGIDCKQLKGKSVETVHRMWENVAAETVHRQPSIILLDDLDVIASAPTLEHEGDMEDKNTLRIVEGLVSEICVMSKMRARVMIMATCKSWKSLHPLLTTTRGNHLFQEIVEIVPPDFETRKEMLKALVWSKPHLSPETMDNLSFSLLASWTEGFDAQDLSILIDRATHAAWIRKASNSSPSGPETTLMEEDFETALSGFTPTSLSGLKLHQIGTQKLQDVGGLSPVKSVIKQILMWPVKYPALFASCPLRPQMSILLFGAPGTGKTLLAEAVANECSLNFISVKGPELLSKYIGGSEQGIRDVFQRAQRARPCILFFDEFDAIAPRRGHDNTGVTDRVVNQILTQMDGVEGLQGVYVLAATSRPDLLDPALLRPGRFDKCLYCPLPDKAERLEILKIHASHLSLAADVNLEQLAECTPFFSGADLQSLLYNAQLEALHDDPHYKARLEETLKDRLAATIESPVDEEEMAKLFASRKQRRKSSAVVLTDDIVYFPSVEEGSVQLGLEQARAILQEVAVIKENLVVGCNGRPRKRFSTFSIAITQNHLMKVISKMKPSVSDAERKRYNAIYDAFTRSRGGDFSSSESIALSGGKRVTLA